MKISKKIILGLSVLMLALALFLVVVKPPGVLADAGPGDIGAGVDSFTALDGATIKGVLGSSGNVTFRDNNPQDSTFNFVPSPPNADGLCDPGDSKDQNGINGNIKYGVNYTDPVDLAAKSINANVKLGFQGSGGLGCTPVLFKTTVANPNSSAAANLEYSDNDIVAAPGFSGYPTYHRLSASSNLYSANTAAGTCGGGDVIAVSASNIHAGTRYVLTDKKGAGIGKDAGTDAHSIAALSSAFSAGQCYLFNSPAGVVIAGTPGSPSPGGNDVGGVTTTADGSCEQNSGGWALTWIACPVLNAASQLTTGLISIFEGQLSFSVGQLGNSSDKVRQSWSLVKDIASALIVIVMLVMILSQAVSFGPFDAYTVRKLLPRLVAVVVLMQISWPLFSWVIDLVNDIARGLADIMYYPFGGSGQMDLWHLLANAHVSQGLLTTLDWSALVVGAFLGVAFLFTMLGYAFVAITALFFAIATLIFRKVLIILLLILSPLALLAWVLPGTERYWKLWWDNFIKVLFMFPIAVAIIAAGRIFAYVVGAQDNSSIATAGSGTFLSLLFIMVGFFGPLFILPRTFRWGGTVMKTAGEGIMKASSKVSDRPKKFFDSRQEGWSQLRQARSAHRYANPAEYNKSRGARIAALWQKPVDRLRAGDYDPTLGTGGSELRTRQKASFLAKADEYTEKQRQEALNRAVKQESRLNESDDRGGNKDDMYQDILRMARGEKALKSYYDYDGNEINLEEEFIGKGERNRDIARRAALDRMTQLGADTNWTHIDAEDERVRAHGTATERASWRRFLNDNKDQVLEKMPDLLKGVGSVADISADGISRMHGAGIKRMISKLDAAATDITATPESRATAQARLSKFLTTYSEALGNNNLRGHLEQGGLRAVKAYITRDNATRRKLLYDAPYEIHSNEEDGREMVREHTAEIVTPTGGKAVVMVGDQLLKPLIKADLSGDVTGAAAAGLAAVPPTLRDELDAEIAPDGSFHASVPAQATLSPVEIRIQHENVASRILPPPITLAPGAPAREAFKLQVASSPEIIQTLANNIAYGTAPPEYQQVLEEMRIEAEDVITNPASTPEQISQAQNNWNNIAGQVQQAYQKRLDEEVAHAVQSGVDPVMARTAAMQAPDPATGQTYADEIQDLMPVGGSPLRRF